MGQSLARETNAPREVYKTGVGLGPCNGLVATGVIEGSPCQVTVDMGSNISIVRPDVLWRSGKEAVIHPVQSRLRTVTGETAPIQGRGRLQLTVGTYQTSHEMWVAEIADECILGLDFLQCHDCQVNLKEGVLHIGNEEVPLQKPSISEPACYRCCAKTSVTIPPLSEIIVPACVDGEWKADSSRWAILQPEKAILPRTGVLIGKTLVDLQRGDIPVRMLNLSREPQRIKRGTSLATCEPVLSVVPSGSVPAQATGVNCKP